MKICAIVQGMEVAWGLGIKKLRIQSDYMVGVNLLNNGGDLSHQHSVMVLNFRYYVIDLGTFRSHIYSTKLIRE
ncbi:hypothetical protein LINPERHAP2_LOCUS42334 [Linum perenne]